MLRNRYIPGLLVFLVLANIVYYFYSNWGLVTVKVDGVPLAKVVKSIEWQGWVKIYTNLPPDTKVSMFVDHVPLAEAMETLAANTGAQWKLGFFVAPSGTAVKEEILSYQKGTPSDGSKTYSYPTRMQLLGSAESDLPAADPRYQTWPGKPVADATISGYLDALAKAADISIIAPSSWNATVSGGPAANVGIIRAVNLVVGKVHGAVTTAFVLTARERRGGGFGGGRGGGGFADDSGFDRLHNIINGLPEEARADAQAQLDQEVKFRKDLAAAPDDQRRDMMRAHMEGKMNGGFMNRMSPARRSQMMQRMVAGRIAAKGGQ